MSFLPLQYYVKSSKICFCREIYGRIVYYYSLLSKANISNNWSWCGPSYVTALELKQIANHCIYNMNSLFVYICFIFNVNTDVCRLQWLTIPLYRTNVEDPVFKPSRFYKHVTTINFIDFNVKYLYAVLLHLVYELGVCETLSH